VPDEEPLVIHRRARNPKQVVEKPVKIRRRKVTHKREACKDCAARAEKEAQYWQQIADAGKLMQPVITSAAINQWDTTPNYPTYNTTTWTSATTVTFDGYTGIWQNIGG
jgi:hypothetical protein